MALSTQAQDRQSFTRAYKAYQQADAKGDYQAALDAAVDALSIAEALTSVNDEQRSMIASNIVAVIEVLPHAPRFENGQPVKTEDVTYRFIFELAN